MVTLAVLGALALLVAIGGWAWWSIAARRKAIAALVRDCPSLEDRLEGRDATLLFSGTEEMLGIASRRVTKLIPYAVIRKWRTEPVYNRADRRVGWNFLIETADPREPLWTIRLRSGPGTSVPNFWMAKFSAHLNG
ncbi:hypothetical protein D9599_05010 [Roseomonas sp. KE2513]|nr:hypothetical protein [Roseomonas sp. KE2513]